MTATELGPIVFAYGGSDLTKAAIDEAGPLLRKGREVPRLSEWRPVHVCFVPFARRRSMPLRLFHWRKLVVTEPLH
jgi:hypothetical protein